MLKTKKHKLIMYVIILIILSIFIFWNQPVIRKYTIQSNLIKNQIKIVQISDLHSTRFGENQIKLIKKINKLTPDVIFLTGDIFDGYRLPDNAYILIDNLVDKYPVYFVYGNHEYINKNTKMMIEKISKKGVIILENSKVEVSINGESILVTGIDDPYLKNYPSESEFINKKMEVLEMNDKTAKKQIFSILLSHRPEFIDIYRKYPFNLVLSGHTHGGQIRIPFLLNGLYAPGEGLFPKYGGGLYAFEELNMIVSRGLSVRNRTPRIFNPPEIVFITLISVKTYDGKIVPNGNITQE